MLESAEACRMYRNHNPENRIFNQVSRKLKATPPENTDWSYIRKFNS